MSPEKATVTSNSIVISSEAGPESEPTLIEQLDLKNAEYVDYSGRVAAYSALKSEFVQEFIVVAGADVVAEAIGRLPEKVGIGLLREPVGFTSFMRNILKIRGDTSKDAVTELSGQVLLSFRATKAFYDGDEVPHDTDPVVRASKERFYTDGNLNKLSVKLSDAQHELGRTMFSVVMGHIATVGSTDPWDEPDDIQANGFEVAKFVIDRETLKGDLSANGDDLFAAHASCFEGQQRTESEIRALVAAEKARIDSDMRMAQQLYQETVHEIDFTVVGIDGDSPIVEPMTDEVREVVLPAMDTFLKALGTRTSDTITLETHDALSFRT